MTGIVHVYRAQVWIHIHTAREEGPYLKWLFKIVHFTWKSQCPDNFSNNSPISNLLHIHSIVFKLLYAQRWTHGTVIITSHSTGMQTCLKWAWQIWSHVTKWKYFNTTGVLCATNFNLKSFLFYTNTEESKMRSLGCQYHRWQTDASLCDEKPIHRGYQTQSFTHLWWGKESRLCGKILNNSSW